MSNTRHRNGSAPVLLDAPASAPESESAPVEIVAPESAPEIVAPVLSAPVLDISESVESEDVASKVRVYVDACSRALSESGKPVCVQRERFADNSLGAYLLASIVPARDGKPESAQRVDIGQLQSQIDALASIGVYVVRDRRPTE